MRTMMYPVQHLVLISAVLGARAAAQGPADDQIVLFPGGAPNETAGAYPPETRTHNDGTGCGANRSTVCDHINDVTTPTLTPFLVSNGTGAAVVIAPGGGYHDLAWTKEGLDTARMFNLMGVSAFVLKYRVPARPDIDGLPKWWAPLQDAQRAIGLLRANAAHYGIDAKRIGFIGFSAGGHLTAHISTRWRERIYPRIDAADDASCRPDFSLFMYAWQLLLNNNASSTSLSPELDDIEKDHPPSFFCQCTDDTTAKPQGSLLWNAKLLAAGAPPPTTHLYPKGGHGFGLCQTMKTFEEVCDWDQAAKRFMQGLGHAPGFPTSRNAPPCEGN